LDNRKYQLYILETYLEGPYQVLNCVVSSGISSDYVPAELLETGHQISKAGSAYPEDSEQEDIVTFNTGFDMEQHLTISRTGFRMTGSAWATSVELSYVGDDGKKDALVCPYLQWAALRQHKQNEEYLSVNFFEGALAA